MPYANNDDTRIHYEVEGAGPPLVLLHGLSDSLASWRDYGFVAGLASDFRLILIDARGHGRSDKPHDPDAYGHAQRAADVVAVLDDLAIDRAHFLGYSLGGWTCYGLAMHAPERIGALVIGGAQPYGQSFAATREILGKGMATWVTLLERTAGPVAPAIKARLLANDDRALAASVAHDRPDISALLPAMAMPCLLYAGGDDPICPLAERAAAELPNGAFFTLPGLNHFQAAVRGDLALPHVARFLAAAQAIRPARPAGALSAAGV